MAVGSAVAGVALALAPAGGAHADQAPPSAQSPGVEAGPSATVMRFVIRGKSRCITVPGWSKRRGTAINLWDCGRPQPGNQRWGIRGPKTGNYVMYQIYNSHNKLCLNVAGGSKANGAKIVQWPCNWKNQNSSWVWMKRAKGQLLFNARSRKCLSVANGSTRNGAALIQWTCNDRSPNQKIFF
ncbi:RICIN domain-containing protein [Actinomadura sp. 9N215]|uniref:RICIN domain-containing protein n=1 Tax=Actinomadura sp. 9N215 TaxID=3375150 RepID=UPI0037A208F3